MAELRQQALNAIGKGSPDSLRLSHGIPAQRRHRATCSTSVAMLTRQVKPDEFRRIQTLAQRGGFRHAAGRR